MVMIAGVHVAGHFVDLTRRSRESKSWVYNNLYRNQIMVWMVKTAEE